MHKNILLTISIAALGSSSAIYAMQDQQHTHEQVTAKMQEIILELLDGVRDGILNQIEPDAEERAACPVETEKCIDLVNKLNMAKTPTEKEYLRCQIDQQVLIIISKMTDLAELADEAPCPPEEKEKLKQFTRDFFAQTQKDVDDRAAKLGLPRLFNTDAGIFSKAKTFVSNHKLMIGGLAGAAIGVILYMRNQAAESDAEARINAVNN